MKMKLDDKNPRIRGCEFYEKYISILVVIPGFQESPSSCPHGPRFSWEDRPTSKASSFCKTQPSNCGKVPLSLSSLSSCFFWSHVSRAEAWLCLFFLGCWWNPQVSLFGLCDLWPVLTSFFFTFWWGKSFARGRCSSSGQPGAEHFSISTNPCLEILPFSYLVTFQDANHVPWLMF